MTFEEAFNPVRALQSSWELLKRAPVPLLVGAILLMATDGGGGSGVSWDLDDYREVEDYWPLIAGIAMVGCCIGLALFLASSWLYIGFARSIESVMRVGSADASTIFDARASWMVSVSGDRSTLWISMMLTRFVSAVLMIATALPLLAVCVAAAVAADANVLDEELAALGCVAAVLIYLPVLVYVGLGLSLSVQACAVEALKPVDAIRRSWSIASGHRLWLLLFHVVTFVFAIIGICACCIGVFLTGSLSKIAAFEAYIAYARAPELPTWWTTTRQSPAVHESWASTPPPPIPPPVDPPPTFPPVARPPLPNEGLPPAV